MRQLLRSLIDRAQSATAELGTLAIALTDDRTPWHAKALVGLTLGLAASPIDPIPDFVPVLGYVDDMVFIPVGVWLGKRMTPQRVLEDAREADGRVYDGPARWAVGGGVVVLWLLSTMLVGWLAWQYLG